jgi:hypothetical protein
MSRRPSWFLVAVAAALAWAVSGCATHVGTPAIQDPAVFDDGFGEGVDFQAFGGSKLDALSIDSTVTHSGTVALKIVVPAAGDPSGTYAGGAFTHGRGRNLTGYDVLSFWAKADHAISLNVAGIGNDNTGTSKYEAKRSNVALTTDWVRYTIALPLPAKLKDEGGLFFFAEGPEAGQGATIWFDDIVFEKSGTVTDPRPAIQTATLTPDVGSYVSVPGTQVTFAVDGVDQTLDMMQGYLTFASSADTVAVGGEGTVLVTGLGTATITASLGGVPATGTLTVTPNPSPQGAAPSPTVPQGSVISLFSNAYTNVPVDTWSASWDIADVADVQVAGNDTKKYTNLVYAGVEFTGAHVLDVTAMTYVHLDVWAAAGTNFKVKLVDFGANGIFGPLGAGNDDKSHELTFTSGSTPALTLLAWSSLEIPMSSFVNLTTRAHLAQLVLSGDVGTVYVDNVYFHQ